MALLLLLALGCGGGSEETGAPGAAGAQAGRAGGGADRPPLILVSIDTLRSDRVPAYGYAGVETPHLDAFRAQAILFEKAYTHVPTTLPAHAAMLTGLLPPEHQVRANMGYHLAAGGLPHLPRLLGERGYATGAAVSSFVLRGSSGLAEGFDFYEDAIDYQPGMGLAGYQRTGGETLAASRDWLRSVAERPFFFFFHLYEPHAPYSPPEPFASRYKDPYDGEIAAADAVVGQLFSELRELGVYDRAAILVTSDHGENLGDHGELGHGILIYRSTIQIPLLLKLPGGRRGGETVTTPAQLIDLPATFLELAGAPLPEALRGTSGRSLLTLGDGEARNVYAETFVPRLYFGWSELRSLVDGRYQYIESAQPELYDLAADPGQTTNVLAENKPVAAEMRRALSTIDPRFGPPSEVDAETRHKLESLGYAGGARSAFQGDLPPPQTQIHLVQAIQEGSLLYAQGRYLKAAQAFRRVVEENAHVILAWEQLALSLEKMGRFQESLAAYQQALERSGGEPHVALAMAEVLLRAQRFDEARRHAEMAVGWDPAASREVLARIALAAGDLDEARRQAQAGLELRSDPALYLALARVERLEGNLPAALEQGRRAQEAAGERRLPGLYLVLGDVLARLGRPQEAEAAFLEEIEGSPGDPLPYSNLAMLYAATGKPEAAVATLRRMVETSPRPLSYMAAVQTLRRVGADADARELLAEGRRRFPNHPGLRQLASG